MDIFGKEALVEIPVLILQEQKTWLEMMVKKGKIAVPPGGSLPEGSVISIFMRTLLWDSQDRGQALEMVTEEALQETLRETGLVQIPIQITEDQKAWLVKAAGSSRVAIPSEDSSISVFIRILLTNAIENQKALEQADPWADDDEE